jgi:hypothetical protein
MDYGDDDYDDDEVRALLRLLAHGQGGRGARPRARCPRARSARARSRLTPQPRSHAAA